MIMISTTFNCRLGQFRLWSPYTSEPFQIANYGLGGQYSTHLDPHSYWEGAVRSDLAQVAERGDRLVTIMAYLEDVAAGGATAFANTGITIPVKKGDAAFWVNLRTSGYVDRYLKLELIHSREHFSNVYLY